VIRLVVVVKAVHGTARFYKGLPPAVASGSDSRVPLPDARFLAISQAPGGVFLYRYDSDGAYAGDTWHESLERAKGQAEYEFELVSPWIEVPPDVADPVSFARRLWNSP
jgi:hypothetical protein